MDGKIIIGNALTELSALPDESVQMCCTSPPYYNLRDYGTTPVEWPEISYSPMPGLPELTIPASVDNLGLESDPFAYAGHLVAIFRELRRVLRDDGVFWLNLGDSWQTQPGKGGNVPQTKWSKVGFPESASHRSSLAPGLKPKDLKGIPWRVAYALQADGWYLRQDIIWNKPNPMPESVTDRCTKAHEYIFLLSKSQKYYYDHVAIFEAHSREWWTESVGPEYMTAKDGRNDGGKIKKKLPESYRGSSFNKGKTAKSANELSKVGDGPRYEYVGRNKRSVWTIATQPYNGAHYAVFPQSLIEPCIAAGSKPGDVVIDPFGGSGTTGMVCERLGRNWVLIDAQPGNEKLMNTRCRQTGLFLDVA